MGVTIFVVAIEVMEGDNEGEKVGVIVGVDMRVEGMGEGEVVMVEEEQGEAGTDTAREEKGLTVVDMDKDVVGVLANDVGKGNEVTLAVIQVEKEVSWVVGIVDGVGD